MKAVVKRLIGKAGYMLFKKKFMPLGISLPDDLNTQVKLSEFNTVFDIGANKGSVTKYFNSIFPGAKIYAFEPTSQTFKLLEENCRSLNGVSFYNFGFSDRTETIKMYLQSDSGLNSLKEAINKPDLGLKGKYEEVHIKTVDSFCASEKITKIDLLKTDAEGLDLQILQGAEQMIRGRKIRFILSEVGFYRDNQRNTFFEDLRSYLEERDYRINGFYWQSTFGSKSYMTTANALFSLKTSAD